MNQRCILGTPSIPPQHYANRRTSPSHILRRRKEQGRTEEMAEAVRQAIHAASIYKHNKWLHNYLAGRRGVRNADINRNGFVDEDEMDNLVAFVAEIAGRRFI